MNQSCPKAPSLFSRRPRRRLRRPKRWGSLRQRWPRRRSPPDKAPFLKQAFHAAKQAAVFPVLQPGTLTSIPEQRDARTNQF
jgi:hypothetical protein